MANYPQYVVTQQGCQPVYQTGYQGQGSMPNQAYVQSQPMNQPQTQTATGLVGRMVTSREEALGVPVDFAGGLMVFPDVSHGAVYTKVFNAQTGQAEFAEYRRVSRPEPKVETQVEPYALESDVKCLREKVEELTEKLAALQPKRKAQKEAAEDG